MIDKTDENKAELQYGVFDAKYVKLVLCSTSSGCTINLTNHFLSVQQATSELNTWVQNLPSHHSSVVVNFVAHYETHNGDPLVIAGNYVQDVRYQKHLVMDGFVKAIADALRTQGCLSLPPLCDSAHIHVSWDALSPYLEVCRYHSRRKPVSNTPRVTRHYFSRNRLDSRIALIRLLEGYDWTFCFSDANGGRHYFFEKTVDRVKTFLLSVATGGRYIYADTIFDQRQALFGLRDFFERYPPCLEALSDFNIDSFARLALPGSDCALEAKYLLRYIGKDRAEENVSKAVESAKKSIDELENSLFGEDILYY